MLAGWAGIARPCCLVSSHPSPLIPLPVEGRGKQPAARRRWLARVACLVFVFALLPAHAQQTVGGSITGGWKLPHYDAQNRLRSLISGSNVTATTGSALRVEHLKIDYFGEDGALEFTAQTPECVFNLETRTASSAGSLRARSADQRLDIQGRGFLLQQATSSLLLSNDVRALLQPGTNMAGLALAPTPAPAAPARATNAPLEITSATFEMNLSNRTAVFRDRVRAHDPQFEMTGGTLTARFAGTNNALDAIEAERNVVLTGAADASRVTADRAVYTLTNDSAVLTGNLVFQQRGRSGRAERVTFHRRDRALDAEGAVVLRVPREELGRSSFLLSAAGATNAPAVKTNIAPAWVEIYSQRLQSRTNLTLLDGDVRLVDGTNKMSTGRLTLETIGTNTTPVRARAEDGLLIEQGARRVKADRGVYERASESITFYGRPEWKLDDLEGVADSLKVFPRTNAVEASGDLRLKLLRVGGMSAMLPVFTNAAPAPTNAAPARTNAPVEVTAQKLVLTNNYVSLTGGVVGRELPATGAESRFRAAQVLIELAPGGQRAQGFSANGGVVVEQGTTGATNGPAAYRRFQAGEVDAGVSPQTGALQTFRARIGVRVEQPGGWAAGDRADYDATTDTVALTGTPTAQFDIVTVTEAAALLWQRGSNTLEVTAPHKFELRPSAGTTNTVPKMLFR